MILASESFMKAKVQKAELDRQEVERKKLEIQALKDNAEYYPELILLEYIYYCPIFQYWLNSFHHFPD